MVTMVSLECPSCGAELQIENGRKECYCSYCGKKIRIDDSNKYTVNINYNANVTNRIINDAEVIRAKNEHVNRKLENQRLKNEIKLKEVEADNRPMTPLEAILGTIVVLALIGAMFYTQFVK